VSDAGTVPPSSVADRPLAVYLIVFVTSLVRTPKLKEFEMDQDAEEEEEESLLATTGRRFGATWQDITGRGKKTRSSGEGPRLVDNERDD
jgi:LMBR1 domain-containing protein 1